MAQTGLTDHQQGLLLAAALIIPSFITWLSAGAPTDHVTLALLGASVLGGVLGYLKEVLGISTPATAGGIPAA